MNNQEKTSLLEIQKNEMEALKAIFMDDFSEYQNKTVWKVTSSSPEFILTVRPLYQNLFEAVFIKIHVRLTQLYPKKAPVIEFLESRGLSKEQINQANNHIQNELIPKLVGSEMIYDITSYIQEFITSNNVSDQVGASSFYDSMIKRQDTEKSKETLKNNDPKLDKKIKKLSYDEVSLIQNGQQLKKKWSHQYSSIDWDEQTDYQKKVQLELTKKQEAIMKGKMSKINESDFKNTINHISERWIEQVLILRLEKPLIPGSENTKDKSTELVLEEIDNTDQAFKVWGASFVENYMTGNSLRNNRFTVLEVEIDGPHYQTDSGVRKIAELISEMRKQEAIQSNYLVPVLRCVLEPQSLETFHKMHIIQSSTNTPVSYAESLLNSKTGYDSSNIIGGKVYNTQIAEQDGTDITGHAQQYSDQTGWRMYIVSESQFHPYASSLNETLKSCGSMGLDRVKSYARDLLMGLSTLHSKNITHRSIHSRNIILKNVKSSKLPTAALTSIGYRETLFALHRIAKVSTQWGENVSFCMRVSPEVLYRPDLLDRWNNDIYCLGLVFLEMALGFEILERVPMGHEIENPKVIKALNEMQKMCHSQSTMCNGSGVSYEHLSIMIRKMLSVEPGDRPTALELLKDDFFTYEPYEPIVIRNKTGMRQNQNKKKVTIQEAPQKLQQKSYSSKLKNNKKEKNNPTNNRDFIDTKKYENKYSGKDNKDFGIKSSETINAKSNEQDYTSSISDSYKTDNISSISFAANNSSKDSKESEQDPRNNPQLEKQESLQLIKRAPSTESGKWVTAQAFNSVVFSEVEKDKNKSNPFAINVSTQRSRYNADFEEISFLGKGGFGSVVKARNRIDGRIYAIKKVSLDSRDTESNRKIFREVTTLSRLHHPNVVRYYTTWLEDASSAENTNRLEESDEEYSISSDSFSDDSDYNNSESESSISESESNDYSSDSDLGNDSNDRICEKRILTKDTKKDKNNGKAGFSSMLLNKSTSLKNEILLLKSPRVDIESDMLYSTRVSNSGEGFVEFAASSQSGYRSSGKKNNYKNPKNKNQYYNNEKNTGSKSLINTTPSNATIKTLQGHSNSNTDAGLDTLNNTGNKKELIREVQTFPPPTLTFGTVAARIHQNTVSSKSIMPKTSINFSNIPARVSGTKDFSKNKYPNIPSYSLPESAHSNQHRSSKDQYKHIENAANTQTDTLESSLSYINYKDDSDSNSNSASGSSYSLSYTPSTTVTKSKTKENNKTSSSKIDTKINAKSTSESKALADLGLHGFSSSKSGDNISFDYISESESEPSEKEKSDSSVQEQGSTSSHKRKKRLKKQKRRGKDPIQRYNDKMLYIQMEYCENKTLSDLISEGIDEKTSWRLFRQMLEGLAHIHKSGMIHRDLKPTNIFLSSCGEAEIGDFGLATSSFASIENQNRSSTGYVFSSQSGIAGLLSLTDGPGSSNSNNISTNVHYDRSLEFTLTTEVGTSAYIAPEVLNQRESSSTRYNHKVDMYSLGIIFFEMCHPLHTGMERAVVIHGIRKPEIEFPKNFSRGMVNQARIIKMLLTHNVRERPSSLELLESNLLPPKMEDEYLYEFIRSITSPSMPHFDLLMRTLFQRTPDIHIDATFDYRSSSRIQQLDAVYLDRIREAMIRVFRRHAFIEFVTPSVSPKSTLYESSLKPAYFIDPRGNQVLLPYDLTIPFARYVARSKITEIKRYCFDRIYRENAIGGQPRYGNAISFDIVINEGVHAVATGEIILVVNEILRELPAFYEASIKLVMNHVDILDAILAYAGIHLISTDPLYQETNGNTETIKSRKSRKDNHKDIIYVSLTQLRTICMQLRLVGLEKPSAIRRHLQGVRFSGQYHGIPTPILDKLSPFLEMRGSVSEVEEKILSILDCENKSIYRPAYKPANVNLLERSYERIKAAFMQLRQLEAARKLYGIDMEFEVAPMFVHHRSYYEGSYLFQVLLEQPELDIKVTEPKTETLKSTGTKAKRVGKNITQKTSTENLNSEPSITQPSPSSSKGPMLVAIGGKYDTLIRRFNYLVSDDVLPSEINPKRIEGATNTSPQVLNNGLNSTTTGTQSSKHRSDDEHEGGKTYSKGSNREGSSNEVVSGVLGNQKNVIAVGMSIALDGFVEEVAKYQNSVLFKSAKTYNTELNSSIKTTSLPDSEHNFYNNPVASNTRKKITSGKANKSSNSSKHGYDILAKASTFGLWTRKRCDVVVASFDQTTSFLGLRIQLVKLLWSHNLRCDFLFNDDPFLSFDALLQICRDQGMTWLVVIERAGEIKLDEASCESDCSCSFYSDSDKAVSTVSFVDKDLKNKFVSGKQTKSTSIGVKSKGKVNAKSKKFHGTKGGVHEHKKKCSKKQALCPDLDSCVFRVFNILEATEQYIPFEYLPMHLHLDINEQYKRDLEIHYANASTETDDKKQNRVPVPWNPPFELCTICANAALDENTNSNAFSNKLFENYHQLLQKAQAIQLLPVSVSGKITD
ncbi:hypothetical protein BB558_001109 [Smittium angustum]|uniref:non-specific serine/threonine protein kinase n=1 Tax=Smittium angustum TaxID=133377 RepID=A0A2U1JCI7_SMIAN|nr:hypothetical protein BB558_001109 [Smittium angustum]